MKALKYYQKMPILTIFIDSQDLLRVLQEPGDKEKADAVLQVSVAANRKNYDKVRRTSDMCEALRELMKEEIEEELKKNHEQGIEQGRINSNDLVMQNLLPTKLPLSVQR